MTDLQCATRLTIVRHAEAEYESQDLGDQGGSLTALGRRQALELAQTLASERIAHVWTSPHSRAVQTAEIAAAALGVGVTVREALVEVSVGDFAGQPSQPDPIRPVVEQWAAGDFEARIAGAESGAEVVQRLRDVLDEIADVHRGESVLVVSHGGVMCTALPTLADNLSMNDVLGSRLPNCGVVRIDRDADGWAVRSWAGSSRLSL